MCVCMGCFLDELPEGFLIAVAEGRGVELADAALDDRLRNRDHLRVELSLRRFEISSSDLVGRRDAGLHIRFTALGTDDELAIARYIDEVSIGWE